MTSPKAPLDFIDFCQQYQLASNETDSLRLYQTYLDNLTIFHQVMAQLVPAPKIEIVAENSSVAHQSKVADKK